MYPTRLGPLKKAVARVTDKVVARRVKKNKYVNDIPGNA